MAQATKPAPPDNNHASQTQSPSQTEHETKFSCACDEGSYCAQKATFSADGDVTWTDKSCEKLPECPGDICFCLALQDSCANATTATCDAQGDSVKFGCAGGPEASTGSSEVEPTDNTDAGTCWHNPGSRDSQFQTGAHDKPLGATCTYNGRECASSLCTATDTDTEGYCTTSCSDDSDCGDMVCRTLAGDASKACIASDAYWCR